MFWNVKWQRSGLRELFQSFNVLAMCNEPVELGGGMSKAIGHETYVPILCNVLFAN